MGLRPKDRYCCQQCRWRWIGKQPARKARRKITFAKWNKENFDHRRNYQLNYTYGIDQEWYENKLAEQDGGCAICGKTPEEEGRSLSVDHDHKTGEIFGILCTVCNKILVGHIREPSAFQRAADYLAKGTGLFVPPKSKKKRKRKRK